MRLTVFQLLHVDDRDLGLFQVRRRQQGAPIALPGDAGAQVRHAVEVQLSDLAAHVQVDHLAVFCVAGRADQQPVRLVEEEVVQIVVEADASHREGAAAPGTPSPMR